MSHQHRRFASCLMLLMLFTASKVAAQEKASAQVIAWKGSTTAIQNMKRAWVDYWSNFGVPGDEYARLAYQQDPTSIWARGAYTFRLNNNKEAWSRLTQDAAANGSLGELLLVLAWRERAAGHPAESAALSATAAQLYPDDPVAVLEAALTSVRGKKASEAADVVTAAARKVHFPAALVYYNLQLIVAGDTARALSLAEEFVRTAPQLPESHNALAQVLAIKGDIDGALQQASAAIQVDPASTQPHVQMAELTAQKGDFVTARVHIGHAIANAKTPVEQLSMNRVLAVTYAEEGKYAEALKQLQQCAQTAQTVNDNAQTAIIHRNLALLAAFTKHNDQVTPELERAVQAGDAGTLRYQWAATTYAIAGLSDDADAALKQYIDAVGPTPNAATQKLIHTMTGMVLVSRGQAAEGLEHLNQGDPRNVFGQLMAARAHKKLGHKAEVANARAFILSQRDQISFVQFPGAMIRAEARKL